MIKWMLHWNSSEIYWLLHHIEKWLLFLCDVVSSNHQTNSNCFEWIITVDVIRVLNYRITQKGQSTYKSGSIYTKGTSTEIRTEAKIMQQHRKCRVQKDSPKSISIRLLCHILVLWMSRETWALTTPEQCQTERIHATPHCCRNSGKRSTTKYWVLYLLILFSWPRCLQILSFTSLN